MIDFLFLFIYIDEIEAEGSEVVEKEAEPLPELSGPELIAYRRKKLSDRKQRIAELATAVIENPEESVSLCLL